MIRIWDLEKEREAVAIKGGRWSVQALLFLADGRTLVSQNMDGYVTLWEVKTGHRFAQLEEHASALALSPECKILAGGGFRRTVYLWEVKTLKRLNPVPGHEDVVSSIAFSPAGNTLGTAGWDSSIRVWDYRTGKEMRKMDHRSPTEARLWEPRQEYLSTVCFSADGEVIAAGSFDSNIVVWRASTGEKQKVLRGHSGIIDKVRFDPTGKSLVSCCSGDNTIRVWDVISGRANKRIEGTKGGRCFDISPDGKYVAMGAAQDVRIWEIASGNELGRLRGKSESVRCLAFSPDGGTLCSGKDGIIDVWDFRTKKLTCRVENGASAMVFCGSRFLAVTTGGREIHIWDLNQKKRIGQFESPHGWVTCLAYQAGPNILASGSRDSTILLWDVSSVIKTESKRLK